ncbi:predicted protein [Verticillium alfalfae VaMs.102]|uniref:Predicted protein n=1 Tax=Verticillium alfalfae (strain VaMs.102 / ATCC MYA-4576 / FGSC 10136) TaxID=526221 RepID=C9SDC0_VERA1|nr:predicted protein [Verticillium alfalfae VaMs.102]EEY17072.1 predicted protein [Verticillium alfalfae VaMs.102]
MWRYGGPVGSSLILPFKTSVYDVILGVVPALEASSKSTPFRRDVAFGQSSRGNDGWRNSGGSVADCHSSMGTSRTLGARCSGVEMNSNENRRKAPASASAMQSGHAAGSVETTAGGWPTLGIIRAG